MRVSPEIYRVTIETEYVSNDCSLEEFMEKQGKYRGFDFLILSNFNEDDKYSRSIIEDSDIVLSKDQLFSLSVSNIRFTVNQKIEVSVDITQQLIDFAEKPIKLVQESSGSNTYNNKCEVHMPGHSLSLYNEMMLKEDCCTDEIQSSLNSGWRIISVCPQPDQRRPDYIMGRFNPDINLNGSAER